MIVDALIRWFTSVVTTVLNWFPTDTVDYASISASWGFLTDLNYFLPIGETVLFVAAILAIGPAFLTATILTWLTVGVARGGSSHA